MADAGEITWERRGYRPGDLTDAWYALIATSDPEANTAASAEGEAHRVWCVRADDAEAATAWTPATGRSAGVTVAVLTRDAERRDPRYTAAVRDAVVDGLSDGTLLAARRTSRAAPTRRASPWSAAAPATPTSSPCAAAACSPRPTWSSPTGSARATCSPNCPRTSR